MAEKLMKYADATKKYDVVFGLETHVELSTNTKLFCPAHIEDDAGKNTHVGGADGRIEGADHSLVDYNRAGVPLIEIVTKPIEGAGDRAPEIAGAYMRAIRDIVRALNISHARMEQGNMRADVNVSLRPSADAPYGTRSETKNVNSFRGIEKTIQYEIRRQAARLDDGKEILQETRHWDEATQTTAGGRLKSDADDYRYFPDPDLVMLHITKEHIEEMKANDKLAKQTVEGVLKGEGTPDEVVRKHGYKIVEDNGAIESAVDAAFEANPDVVEKLKSGNMKPMGVIIGAVMKATRGQADAKAVTKVVMSKIKG